MATDQFGGTEVTTDQFGGALVEEPPKPAGAFRRAADTGLALAKGVVGVPEAAVGIADLVTGGRAGKAAEAAGVRFKDAKQVLTDFQSPEQHAADAAVQQADGFFPTVGAMVQNPSTIVNAAVESAPSMVLGGAAGRGALAVAPRLGAIGAGAVGEGAVAAGQNAEQVRQEDLNGTLTARQAAILAASGLATGAIGLGAGKVANRLGLGDVSTMLTAGKLGPVGEQAAAAGVRKGIFRRAGEGAAVEGLLQELPQSMQEQAAQNLAQDKPLGEGVGAAGAQGLLVGGLTGGLAGPMGGSAQAAATTPPVSPMERAANLASGLELAPAPAGTTKSPSDAEQIKAEGYVGRPLAGFDPANPGAPRPLRLQDTEQGGLDFAPEPTASQLMGIDPAAGPLSASAALAVDTGTSAALQAQQAAEQQAAAQAKEPAAKAPKAGEADFATSEQAQSYISAQKRAGGVSFQALPLPKKDGTFGIAVKGSPDYTIAEFHQKQAGLRAAGMLDGDILNKSGDIFKSRIATAGPLKKAGPGFQVVPVQGGFVIRAASVEATNAKPAAAPTPAPAQKPAAEQGARAQAAIKTVAPAAPKPAALEPEQVYQQALAKIQDDYEAHPNVLRRDAAKAKAKKAFEKATKSQRKAPVAQSGKAQAATKSIAKQKPRTSPPEPARVQENAPPKAIEQAQAEPAQTPAAPEAATVGQPAAGTPAGADAVEAARVAATQPAAIAEAAHAAATSPQNDLPEPTDAQKEAGNYKKGHLNFDGLDLTIENPEGSSRTGTDPDGKPWTVDMTAHYGYVKRTTGADGEQVDVYLSANPVAGAPVFVFDQQGLDGKFDEHKAVLGVATQVEAEAVYDAHFSDGSGPKRRAAMTQMSVAEFKDWARSTEAVKPAAAQQAPAPAATKTVATSKPVAKIDDAGAVLEGARKLYEKVYRAKLDEAMGMDLASQPLSKTWPEPDYQRMIDDGMEPWAVAFARAARDEIPNKPSQSWKLKRWTENVQLLRNATAKVLDGSRVKELVIETGKGYHLTDWFNKIDLYEAVGHERSLKGMTFSRGTFSLYAGEKFDPPKVMWTVTQPSTSASATWNAGRWSSELAVAPTKEEAIEKFKSWLAVQGDKTAAETKAMTFDVYSIRGKPGVTVGKRLSSTQSIDLKSFDTVEQARAYKAANQAELEKLLEAAKFVPPERRATNSPRVGVDHRNGADVTNEQFRETFGFRGEQFGASMPQGERQSNLNQAYDSLMDLAGVIGVPPRALSLNGELGLAFGSRGRGGKRPAAAHYEPDATGVVTPNRVVINLTRKNGAGSLAHEWFHAVDNYFARRQGQQAGFMTERIVRDEGVRREMKDAFTQLMKTINLTSLAERSKTLDKTRTKAYWSTGLEMAARSFESYVIAKLQDQSASNDYLANIVSEEQFKVENGYPYPTAGEQPQIRAAFDHFFDTVQIKEDEFGNVAMQARDFDRAALRRFVGAEPAGMTVTEAKAITDRLTAGWKNAPRVVVLKDASRSPVEVDARARGLYHQNTVYVFAENNVDANAVARTVAHESIAHHGLRQLLGPMRWIALMKNIQKGIQNGDVSLIAHRDYVEQAYKNQNLSPNLIADEIAARVVEDAVDPVTGEFRPAFGFVKQVYAQIREWLRSRGFDINFSNAELQGMLRAAMMNLEAGKRTLGGGDMVAAARGDTPVQVPPVTIGNPLGSATAHPDYEAAKAGNTMAAVRVAKSLVTDDLVARVRERIGDTSPLVVPVVSEEASGRNQIPRAAAIILANKLGLKQATDIVQSNRAQRTALGGLDRIFAGPEFEGKVEPGRSYLLVDDTLTQGATFASLASHIEDNGGLVAGAVALTGKEYSATLQPTPETLTALREKHGDLESDFRAVTGYGFDALTQSEARYLANFQPADAVRDRILAERREKDGRGDPEAAGPGQLALDAPENMADTRVSAADNLAERFTQLTGKNVQVVGVQLGGIEVRNATRANGTPAGMPATMTPETSPYSPEAMQVYEQWEAMQHPSSKYLFHTTPAANLDSIAKTGLVPNSAQRFAGVSDGRISLAANEAVAKYYGGSGDVLLRVAKNYDVGALEPDLLSGGEGAYVTGKTIPPGALAIKQGRKWVPLLKGVDGFDESGLMALDTPAGMARVTTMATEKLDSFLNVPGRVNWWHKSFGTMYNLAKRSDAFKPVFDAAQHFINDVSFYATEAADMAPRILPKLESWSDIRKSPIKAADNKAISTPIFEGTLVWGRDENGKLAKVDDLQAAADKLSPQDKAQRMLRAGKISEGVLKMWQGQPVDQYEAMVKTRFDSEMLRPGVVFTDAELKGMFGLNDDQISLYREFRAATDNSLDSLARADMLRYGGEDVEALRDQVMQAGDAGEAAVLLRDYLLSLAKSDVGRNDVLVATATGMIDKADKVAALKSEGYAPLTRFGKFTVDVVDGQREYFSLFESAGEAAKVANKMRMLYSKEAVTQGTLSNEAFKLFAGITPESLELFGNMLGLDSTGDQARDKVFQDYLKLTKNNRSAMKRLIHRKGIAGYSEDAGRVLASFIYSNARQTSAALHIGDLGKAVTEIPKEQGELVDVAVTLADYVKNPQEEAQAVRGLLFAQYLGGSIASAAVNMTQPLAVSFPYLSQFGGVRQSGRELTRAYRDLANSKTVYEPKLAKALKHAEETGIVSPQEVHQLMAQARGAGSLKSGDGTRTGDALAAGSNALSRLALAWGKVFGVAEQLNRRSTFIAAFRIAEAQNMANPAGFAEDAVNETQFIYNKANKMRFARGAIGGTLMTFKTYSIAYLELMHRMATQGGPEGKKAALLGIGVLFLLSGAGGLPFADDIMDLVDGALQRLGYNISSKKAKQEFLEGLFGKAGADFVDRGITGLPGVPLDVSGRLGMGNLIPGTGLLQQKASHGNDLAELAGPMGDFIKRISEGGSQLLSGDIGKAALSVAPTAVRNLAKGADMADTGAYRDAKGYKVLDTTMMEAALKAIGFQPQTVSKVQEANYLNQRAKDFYNITAQDIRARWAKGIFEKDPAQVAEARKMLETWNTDNPDQRMTANLPAILKKARDMGKSKDERIAATAPKAMRDQMRRDVADLRAGL
ncbi:PLxRFG domain-containing protein [Polaromonas sp.]|uniref:PLxRFG domain-containing protein n=1 Tax=Polaromonas sp. TaxID=1869339 RepID=UPI00326427CF